MAVHVPDRATISALGGHDLLPGEIVEEGVLDAGVVGDEVELGPVGQGLGQVRGMPVLGDVGQAVGQALVDTDAVEPRNLVLQPSVVLGDQLEGRVSDLLVVVPPQLHRGAGGSVERSRIPGCPGRQRQPPRLGRVGDVVPLPGVGPVVLDLVLDVLQIGSAHVEQAVGHRPPRPGDVIDEVARGRGLGGRQDFGSAGLIDVCHWKVGARLDVHEGGDVAD